MSSDNSLPVPIQEAQPLAVAAVDPTVARNESIAQLLNTAYQRASMLELSDEESSRLMAPFPDEAYSRRDAKRGDQSIVYLEHAYIRDRLLQVFGPGKWTTINRRQWVDRDSDTIYVDMVMLARGAYVGESVGCQKYDIGGHRLSYGEALSGAESDAVSRICGKILGIGLDAWKKSFREEWKRRNPVGGQPAGQSSHREPDTGRQQAEPEAPRPDKATEAWNKWKADALSKVVAIRDETDTKAAYAKLKAFQDWLAKQKIPENRQDILDEIQLAIADTNNALTSEPPSQTPDNPDAMAGTAAREAAREAEELLTVPIMALETLDAIAAWKRDALPAIGARHRPRAEQLVLIQQLTMETSIAKCHVIKEDHPALADHADRRIREIKAEMAKMDAGVNT